MEDNEESVEARTLAIIAGAMDELVEMMPPLEVARVMLLHSVMGLTQLGGYEEILTIVPKAVAKVIEARLQ